MGSGKASQTKHFTDLDGMRGLLACAVMLFHLGFGQVVPALTHGRIAAGAWTLCVDFFFILSGFVLYSSIERARPSLWSFMDRRLRRLAPMFFITLAAMLLFTPAIDPLILVANLLIVQSIFEIASLNFPGWSVPMELFIPALIVPVIGVLARLSDGVVALLLIATLSVGGVLALCCAWDIDCSQLRGLFGIASGTLLGRIHLQRGPVKVHSGLALGLFALTIVIILLSRTFTWMALAFYLVSAATVYSGAQTQTLLSTAPFQALGRWSYSIYLLHIPVLEAVQWGFGSASEHKLLKFPVVAVTLVLSAFCYRYIEMPVLRRSPRRARAQRTP